MPGGPEGRAAEAKGLRWHRSAAMGTEQAAMRLWGEDVLFRGAPDIRGH